MYSILSLSYPLPPSFTQPWLFTVSQWNGLILWETVQLRSYIIDLNLHSQYQYKHFVSAIKLVTPTLPLLYLKWLPRLHKNCNHPIGTDHSRQWHVETSNGYRVKPVLPRLWKQVVLFETRVVYILFLLFEIWTLIALALDPDISSYLLIMI